MPDYFEDPVVGTFTTNPKYGVTASADNAHAVLPTYPVGVPMPKVAPPAPPSTRAGELLRKAASIVDGARNKTHGNKERSFKAIATLWTAYLSARKAPDSDITAADVAAMMVLLKFARSEHGEHVEDHAVDAAGYSSVWGELREI